MGRHSAPEDKPDSRSKTVANRRPGPKHESDKPPPRKRTPQKAAAPASAPPAPRPGGVDRTAERKANRARVVAGEARAYADRAAYRQTHSKPSVAGRGASGAAAGAATGAALGNVVPGVGTAVGGTAGAVVGGVGGAVSGARAKKAYKAALRTNGQARKIIVAEFALCIVIAALSPLTDEKRDETPASWVKRMTAIMGTFFLLGLISAAGRGPARAAAGFGGLVTIALALSQRNLFVKIADVFSSTNETPAAGTGPTEPYVYDDGTTDDTVGTAPVPSGTTPAKPRQPGGGPVRPGV